LLQSEKRRNLGDFQIKTKNFKKPDAKLLKLAKKIQRIYKNMVNENNDINSIPKENYKKVEEVREIDSKYETPSFEEFMKTYESDENLNYDDLNSGDIGTQKGYGPCPDGCEQMLRTEIRDRDGNYVMTLYGAVRFFLRVDCLNWAGGGGYTKYLTSTSTSLDYAHELERGKYSNVSNEVELKCAILIRDAIRHYEGGNKVYGYIKVQGNF